jgi:cytochrome d ubiquinol oxidase subunit II
VSPITLTVDTSRLMASGFDLTVWNSAAQSYGLRVGLIWWSIASALAAVYFIYLYRSFRGKVTLEGDGY